MKHSQSGFTLVELIVVILILGVLAATALPRFINLNDKAYKAAVAATGGAFGTAISLAKAQWVANGHTAAERTLSGFGDGQVTVNANGWAIGNDNDPSVAVDAAACIEIWESVLNNPPRVAAASAAGVEFVATYASNVCTYTYERETSYNIAYNVTTGNVAVTN